MDGSCEEYARAIRQIAKFTFGYILNHYLGNSPLVLQGEAEDGTDITVRATDQWVKANHVSNFGLTREDGEAIASHMERCESPVCVAAKSRLTMVAPLMKEGMPPALAVSSVFVDRHTTALSMNRKNGFGEAIDVLKPFAAWFQEEEFPAPKPRTGGNV